MSQNNSIGATDDFRKGSTNKNHLERKSTRNVLSFFKGASAKQVKTDDLSPDDIIIAVMGPTGSGKSSFINAVTGLETGVGHDLQSCTSEVSNVRLSIPEVAFADLVFVDTPGFDDTHRNDVDILEMVANWLKSTYKKNIFLSGLLYFHRISDNRMAGTPLKNLRMFEQLCGRNAFQNVILTTTMWDEVDEKTGVDRERELKTNYWRAMLERNSTTNRFLRTRESAFILIDPLIEAANKKFSVLLQDELVDMHKSLPATAAGQELFSRMGQLVSQREDLLRRIRNEMKRSDGDKMILEPLQEEHQKLQSSLEATVNEMRKLRLPLGQRFLIMTDKFFSSKLDTLKSLISKIKLSKPAPNTENLSTSPIGSYEQVLHPDHPPTGTILNDPSDPTNQSPPGSISIAGDQSNHSRPSTTKETQDKTVSSNQTEEPTIVPGAPVSNADHPPTGTISNDPSDPSHQSPPASALASDVVEDQSNHSHPSTTKETQGNTVPSNQTEEPTIVPSAPVSNADHPPTGTIPDDSTHQSPPGSAYDIAKDQSNHSRPSTTKETQDNIVSSNQTEKPTIVPTAPVSNADHPPTGTIPNDPSDPTHQSPPGSASDVAGEQSNHSRPSTTKETLNNTVSLNQTEEPTIVPGAPVSDADHRPTGTISNDSSDPTQSLPDSISDVLGRAPTSGVDQSNDSSLSTINETSSNIVSSKQTELSTTTIVSADHHLAVSKNPIDHHRSPGSISDTSFPIGNGSNVLDQRPTNGANRSICSSLSFGTAREDQEDSTVSSDQAESPTSVIVSCAPVSVPNHHPAISKDAIDRTHQSIPGSMSDTPLLIASGSNVLGQGPTNATDRSNRTHQSTPASGSTSGAPLPIANGSDVGQGPSSSITSTVKETQNNNASLHKQPQRGSSWFVWRK